MFLGPSGDGAESARRSSQRRTERRRLKAPFPAYGASAGRFDEYHATDRANARQGSRTSVVSGLDDISDLPAQLAIERTNTNHEWSLYSSLGAFS